MSKSVLAVLCILLMIACDRDPTGSSAPYREDPSRTELFFTDQPQSVNPFDSVGRFHNAAMRYAIANLPYYEVVGHGTAGYMLADFLVDLSPTDTITVDDINVLGDHADSILALYDAWRAGTTRSQRIGNLSAPSLYKSYIMQLLNANDTMSLSGFLNKCDTVALSAMNNSGLDSSWRARVLMVTSIAFHSRQLWDNYIENDLQILGGRGGHIADINKEEQKKTIAEKDLEAAAYGAAAGASVGFAYGSIVGATAGGIMSAGIGMFPGWLLGGVEGGLHGAFFGGLTAGIAKSLEAGVEEKNQKQSTSTPPKDAKTGKVRTP